MLQLGLGPVIMTGLRAQPAAGAGLQGRLKGLVELRFQRLQGEFDGFAHRMPLLRRLGVGEHAPPPEEFTKKGPAEKEVQAMADLAQRQVDQHNGRTYA